MCRIETFARHPDVFTVFACEYMFGKAASVLFAGVFEEIGQVVAARAGSLLVRMQRVGGNKLSAKRLASLKCISQGVSTNQDKRHG